MNWGAIWKAFKNRFQKEEEFGISVTMAVEAPLWALAWIWTMVATNAPGPIWLLSFFLFLIVCFLFSLIGYFVVRGLMSVPKILKELEHEGKKL